VYTTLSFPELNLVDAPRAVTGFEGYKPAFLYDIVVVLCQEAIIGDRPLLYAIQNGHFWVLASAEISGISLRIQW